jgi:hypothetical protein
VRYHTRDDRYLNDIRDSLSVRPRNRRTRAKILGSAAILALVLVAAAIRQWGGRNIDSLPGSAESARSVDTEPPERTVFGNQPSPVGEAAAARGTMDRNDAAATRRDERSRTAGSPVRTADSDTGVPADLRAFLERWRSTLVAGDATAQAALYADRVDRFFTKRSVTRAEVRREKQRMLTRYPEFHKYEISDVRLESLTSDRAVVTFRKEWDARGRGRFAGSEQQRLTLERVSESWKIVGEEETKVHWVRRS